MKCNDKKITTLQLLFVLIILIGSLAGRGENQQHQINDDIYNLVFEDASNFDLTTKFEHKRPKRILIIDTSET